MCSITEHLVSTGRASESPATKQVFLQSCGNIEEKKKRDKGLPRNRDKKK